MPPGFICIWSHVWGVGSLGIHPRVKSLRSSYTGLYIQIRSSYTGFYPKGSEFRV